MNGSGLRGTTAAQDTRFKDKESKALKSTKFPVEFSEKVDVRKVNLGVIRPWIAKTVTDLSGVEDDIVIEYTMELLENPDDPIPDPRKMQISLVGFLGNNAPELMSRLWKLLLSAQGSVGGVPQEFVEAKKAELIAKQKADAEMQQRMMGRAGAGGEGMNQAGNGGGRIHASFPDQRPNRDRPSRWGDSNPNNDPNMHQQDRDRDRKPDIPRGQDGRAFPRGEGADSWVGPRNRGGGGGGGGDRFNGGGGGRGRGDRRAWDERPRERDSGYGQRAGRGRGAEDPTLAMGMRGGEGGRREDPDRIRDRRRYDSRSRSPSRTPPRRASPPPPARAAQREREGRGRYDDDREGRSKEKIQIQVQIGITYSTQETRSKEISFAFAYAIAVGVAFPLEVEVKVEDSTDEDEGEEASITVEVEVEIEVAGGKSGTRGTGEG